MEDAALVDWRRGLRCGWRARCFSFYQEHPSFVCAPSPRLYQNYGSWSIEERTKRLLTSFAWGQVDCVLVWLPPFLCRWGRLFHWTWILWFDWIRMTTAMSRRRKRSCWRKIPLKGCSKGADIINTQRERVVVGYYEKCKLNRCAHSYIHQTIAHPPPNLERFRFYWQ